MTARPSTTPSPIPSSGTWEPTWSSSWPAPQYLEVHVEGVRNRARLARALTVAAGLLCTHENIFAPGSVVHACWDDDRERRSE